MTEDERRSEPTIDEPAANATKPTEDSGPVKGRVEPVEGDKVEADKTDMSAVGDDGQVFGG
jgi:hypothetical protein